MNGLRRGDILLKRYQVLEQSGETALWIGYHARARDGHAGDNRQDPEEVIVKLLRPGLAHDEPSRSYLLRELQRVRLLHHPGVLRPIEVQVLEEDQSVVLIENTQAGLSQGVLLAKMVSYRQQEQEPFTLEEARQIGAQLASALGHIHGQLMCHGDLRLESVLLRPDGVKLCDVGLGRALPRGPYLDAVTRSGELALLAPEVRTGRPPDARADVFGLAALYRHMLSLGDPALWETFLTAQPLIAAILRRGMNEDPQLRYPSVEALVADIEAVALTGAPLRRRPAHTPLAMAVAAGRLPVEELARSVEEMVPEGRRRRNSGTYDVDAVLAPLSGSPSARVLIGTIPPGMKSAGSDKAGPESAAPVSPAAAGPGSRGRESGSTPPASGRKRTVSRIPVADQGRPEPAPAPSGPRAAAPMSEEEFDVMPTREVRKSDLDQLRQKQPRAEGPSAADIGTQSTLEQARLTPPPSRGALPVELDHTIEQVRLDPAEVWDASGDRFPAAQGQEPLDPGDMPTSAMDLLPEPDLLETPPESPMSLMGSGRGPSGGAIEFHEMPPLMPSTPIPGLDGYAPGPRLNLPGDPAPPVQEGRAQEAAGPPSPVAATSPPADPERGAPRRTAKDAQGTPTKVVTRRAEKTAQTRSSGRPGPRRPAGPFTGKLAVVGALLLAALVGALGAVAVISLFRMHARSTKNARTGRPGEAPAPPPPAPVPAEGPRAEGPKPARAGAGPGGIGPATVQKVQRVPGCPPGMVHVSGPPAFCIDQYEFPGRGQRPRTEVSLKEAEAACQGRGQHLCSDEQWELGCRGRGHSSYPYGHDVRQGLCNTSGGAIEAAGARLKCVSASLAYDMAGNAAEWVRSGNIRGGSAQGENDGRCSKRLRPPEPGRGPFLGFRCCAPFTP